MSGWQTNVCFAMRGRCVSRVVVAWLLLPASIAVAGDGQDDSKTKASVAGATWALVARLDRNEIEEVSGVVASRRHPGVFWSHGDSGNAPTLTAFDLSGKILAKVEVGGAPNTDWEDIAADDKGFLYIGDIGNNEGVFPARYIYKIEEPDPAHPPKQPVRPVERFRYRYGEGERFNAEGLFVRDGRLYVLSRPAYGPTAVYRLDAGAEGDLIPEKITILRSEFATGADLAADGKHFVVCAARTASVYAFDENGGIEGDGPVHRIRFPKSGQIEGCCFSGPDVILVSEEGAVYHVAAEQIEADTIFDRR